LLLYSEGSTFFFEKKKQKTFVVWSGGGSVPETDIILIS
jgi:hypothetical protein